MATITVGWRGEGREERGKGGKGRRKGRGEWHVKKGEERVKCEMQSVMALGVLALAGQEGSGWLSEHIC